MDKYDSKSVTGTVQVHANGAVIGTGTEFSTQADVGDVLYINSAVSFIISSVTNNTAMTVSAAVKGSSVNAVASGTSYYVRTPPKSVLYSETPKPFSGNVSQMLGVSSEEMQSTDANSEKGKIAHAGWVRKTEGTGKRAGRTFYEVLVAGSSITGDINDDDYDGAGSNTEGLPETPAEDSRS